MTLSRRQLLKHSIIGSSLLTVPGIALGQVDRSIKLAATPQTIPWFLADVDPIQLWSYSLPELRLMQYEKVSIDFHNKLDEPSTVHWHGMRVKNSMDGVSGLTQPPVAPSEHYKYELEPIDAGTYWAHSHHNSYEQVARGLYMPIIVEEPEAYPVDDDLLFVADDWRINKSGQLDLDSIGRMHDWSHGGRMGNMLTVNRNP